MWVFYWSRTHVPFGGSSVYEPVRGQGNMYLLGVKEYVLDMNEQKVSLRQMYNLLALHYYTPYISPILGFICCPLL